MTPSIDQTLHQFANLLPNWTLLPILTLLPNFGGFHRTLQRVRLANKGRLLLRTPGPVPFGTCICSNVETILSWTCHVYGPFEFRTSLGTSILLFQQTVGIPIGTDCAPLLADIFLYWYEADFMQSLLSTGKKHLASRFNLTYRYIDVVLSINNPEFENYLGQMYPAELEINDTRESTTSASYLYLLLSIGRDV